VNARNPTPPGNIADISTKHSAITSIRRPAMPTASVTSSGVECANDDPSTALFPIEIAMPLPTKARRRVSFVVAVAIRAPRG
jgi:hypothetical protein